MNKLKSVLIVLCCALAVTVQAEDMSDKRKALLMGLYPPDLIMRKQQELGITSEQRGSIQKVVQAFQLEVSDLQWTLQSEQQLLREKLSGNRINTDEALEQAETLLAVESAFKLAHLRLLIAIKNELTLDQISMIDRMIKQKVSDRGT